MARVKTLLRRVLFLTLTVALCLTAVSTPAWAAENRLVVPAQQLMTSGNKVVLASNPTQMVWLTGLNIGGSNWMRQLNDSDERIAAQITQMIEHWNVNCVRFPVSLAGWNDAIRWWNWDNGSNGQYKRDVQRHIKRLTDAGIYVILDLHEFHYPTERASYRAGAPHNNYPNTPNYFEFPGALPFWQEIAQDPFYANNPAILFGVFNEYTYETGDKYESWDIWRNGGVHSNGDVIIGHQQIVEAIRDLGAMNIILAGGLDWGYDLSGVAGVAEGCEGISFALEDKGTGAGGYAAAGYGIVYDTHIYPWKDEAHWDYFAGAARKQYPLLIGENGYDPNDGTQRQYAPQWTADRHREWVPMFFDWVNDTDGVYGTPAHWTGWCFHTGASPRILLNWDFVPTEYWGVYVKEQLLARDNAYITIPHPKTVVEAIPSAYVTQFPGNQNDLTITVKASYFDLTKEVLTKTFRINNNAAGTYAVGNIKVYVDTKGNTQIRACYIVN